MKTFPASHRGVIWPIRSPWGERLVILAAVAALTASACGGADSPAGAISPVSTAGTATVAPTTSTAAPTVTEAPSTTTPAVPTTEVPDAGTPLPTTEGRPTSTQDGEPGVFSDAAAELLAEAIDLPYEEFELPDGITSQVLYQFRSTGRREAFVLAVKDDVAERGLPVRSSRLTSIQYDVISWDAEHVSGVGYFDNLLVIVEGSTERDVVLALSELDNEWCCGTDI